jgi:hypothetical protein
MGFNKPSYRAESDIFVIVLNDIFHSYFYLNTSAIDPYENQHSYPFEEHCSPLFYFRIVLPICLVSLKDFRN